MNNLFDDVDLTHFFKSVYQDRGKQKWAGFYLSEHTEEMATHDTNQKVVKERLMFPDEINQVLVEAQLKRSYLSVQKEDFTYFRGYLTGFDNESITIDLKTLGYEEIRFVDVVNFEKW